MSVEDHLHQMEERLDQLEKRQDQRWKSYKRLLNGMLKALDEKTEKGAGG